MNNKAVSLSVVMAVIAVFFVHSYVSSIEEEAKKKFGTEVLVIKAKKDIREQETLNETSLELALVPKNFIEPASINFGEKKKTDDESQKILRDLAGSIAVVPIKKGEQIAYNKITVPGIRTGLAPQIAPGRRAIAVPVNEVSGVAKLVKPGDRVDLIAVLDAGGGKENKLVKTLLQDVVVLSVGRNVTNNIPRLVEHNGDKEKVKSLNHDTSFASVTLEVEPQHVQVIALVLSNGENALTLSLRNNDDTERSPIPAMTTLEMLGADAARVQRRPAGK